MIKQMKRLVGIVAVLIFTFGLPQIASAVQPAFFETTVVLDQFFYDPSLGAFPYYYHYSVTNSADSTHAVSHWSIFIPCMHSGSTDLSSIKDPEGFTHEAGLFEQIYWGIKWEDIPNDGLEPLEPGSTVACFGFYSSLPKGTVEWKSKGGQLWDDGTVYGPSHNPIPEPATLSLLSLGFLGFGFLRRKRRGSS